ncbi:protein phosphatase 2C domain-containing protein [Chryseobacterium sp. SL1]|uniref:protein phosphatase 2C domain-containing protein n=1 Tax=Chryseobacterium sp. SL1 TaxID=2995159 RepID=UPI002273B1C2|nr:protein phosphatase 2C domain-containing protein [Chryseobacterium sp. SL1]MCY1660128.1 protein phosphatase 2C domain-containing protein [Chryseobacterium sp. SL1]
MNNLWEKAPFGIATGGLTTEQLNTKLPFSVGGISRQGLDHIHMGVPNQDAVNIIIQDDFIIGVVADGCTSNNENSVDSFSSNQVGAQLLAKLIGNLCCENISPRKNRINKTKFLHWLSEQTLQRLEKILDIMRFSDKERKQFSYQTLTATVIGFIIRREEFFLFHCGDGIVQSNQNSYNLSSHSGSYLSKWIDRDTPPVVFNKITEGKTKDLSHLYIATDGFLQGNLLKSEVFQEMLHNENQSQKGFVDLIPEFHMEVLDNWEEMETNAWPGDDSSMIMVRRKKQST